MSRTDKVLLCNFQNEQGFYVQYLDKTFLYCLEYARILYIVHTEQGWRRLSATVSRLYKASLYIVTRLNTASLYSVQKGKGFPLQFQDRGILLSTVFRMDKDSL